MINRKIFNCHSNTLVAKYRHAGNSITCNVDLKNSLIFIFNHEIFSMLKIWFLRYFDQKAHTSGCKQLHELNAFGCPKVLCNMLQELHTVDTVDTQWTLGNIVDTWTHSGHSAPLETCCWQLLSTQRNLSKISRPNFANHGIAYNLKYEWALKYLVPHYCFCFDWLLSRCWKLSIIKF